MVTVLMYMYTLADGRMLKLTYRVALIVEVFSIFSKVAFLYV